MLKKLFTNKDSTNSMVGVDLGVATIKIVELKNENKKPTLVTYGVSSGDRQATKEIHQNISPDLIYLMQQARTTTTNVVGALPTSSVFSTIIDFPKMPTKEIDSAIKWEARKLIPLPLEKMSLHWHILPTVGKTKDDDSIKVILSAAPTETTTKYLKIFKAANLSLLSLETEIKALQRSLLTPTDKTSLIIDIGANNTNMIIYDNNLPLLNKNIDIGGETLTSHIAKTININFERAAQLKKQLGMSTFDQASHPAVKAMKFAIDNIIIRDIKHLITVLGNSTQNKINNIILTGGGAHLKNLDKYLENELKINTRVGDPWHKISYPKELKSELGKIGTKMSVAIGLALKVVEK
ncbi:MAG: type IV pilus assembly protein PilM [Candidatus Kerfeldbacteria bacterium]|jgi:type IV pilus assembly protein PilM